MRIETKTKMLSKTRKRQLRRSNQEISFEQIRETPVEQSRNKNVNTTIPTGELTGLDIESVIREDVENN